MSTRATYLLSTNDGTDQTMCFYVHYNGYPEGAATYFWQMHQYKNQRSGYAGRFFRANENAEFTLNPEAHRDTAYRYSIDKNGHLIALARINFSEEWKIIHRGMWYEFVNKYRKEEEDLYFFKYSDFSDKGFVMTLAEVQASINAKIAAANEAASNGWIGNAGYLEGEAKCLQRQLNVIIDSVAY